MEKQLYFRIYLSKDDTDGPSYVDTVENVMNDSIPAWFDLCDGELPVLEPVMMTEDEFKNLPVFDGF